MNEQSPDVSYIIDLMKKKSGIVFSQEKSYIMITKLYPLLEKYNFADINDLITSVRLSNDDELEKDIVDHLTTNETSFFRDRNPFEAINKIYLPELISKLDQPRTLRILCAACSTGQEPYSLAMNFMESKANDLNFKITAVDIATNVINKAKDGIYNQFEVQRGLPITYLVKYFSQVEKNWQIKDEVKAHVDFRQFNLMNDMTALGHFDIVFCRNVLIYFDQDLRTKVIQNISNILRKDGILVLGGTEFIANLNPILAKIEDQNGFYRKI